MDENWLCSLAANNDMVSKPRFDVHGTVGFV